MCRNIKRLGHVERQPSDAELRDAALQYVRKISGFRKPSRVNQATFDRAIDDIVAVTHEMFRGLTYRPTRSVTPPASVVTGRAE